jgi:hypothetical protein
MVAGAALAIGLGLTGCGSTGEDEPLDGSVNVEDEEVGSPDKVDGGEEDPDGIDPGTGGIDDDDDTGTDSGG